MSNDVIVYTSHFPKPIERFEYCPAHDKMELVLVFPAIKPAVVYQLLSCRCGEMADTMKVYGPYKRKDGRKHVIVYDFKLGIRQTISYPKYLMEQHLGRKLTEDETIDHINNDYTDDRLENLQILSRVDNISKSTVPAEIMTFKCPNCFKMFELLARQYRGNQVSKGKSGPFCSRSCAGQFCN